jgi:hypothetical protein
MNDIIIIDNCIPKKYQDEIEDFLLVNDFSWCFQSDITLSDMHLRALDKLHPDNKPARRPGFGSMMFDPAHGRGNPYHFLAPLIYCGAEKANIEVTQLDLIRGFLSMPVPANKENKIDKPHVDKSFPHIVGLYYVNDSDGDTLIYQETSVPAIDNRLVSEIDPSTLTVVKSITPKKGRLVFFNGKHYHSSTQPTIGPRCVINFHFV